MNRLLLATVLLGLLPGPWAAAGDPEVVEQVERIERFAREPFEQKEREKAIRALGKIGGPDAATALLPLFDDPFVHLRDHAVSAWIAMVKGERAAETLTWMAKKGMKQKRTEVRTGLATALGFATGTEAADLLGARLVKERDTEVLVALLRSVVRVGLPASNWKPIDLLRHRDGRVVLAAADALVRWDACAQVPPSIRLGCLEHRDPLVRAAGVLVTHGAGDGVDAGELVARGAPAVPAIALAEALGRMSPETAWSEIGPPLAVLLGADAWRVRAAAVDAAIALWRREVVPLLIERLDLESGRLRLDLADALGVLSGKDLGPDPELWQSWWETARANFELGARPAGRSTSRSPAPEGETRTASFFRLPVYGTRIAFLLDCSGSMRDPLDETQPGSETKFELARDELEKTLTGLDASVSFDVFLYRYPSEYPPRPELTRALGGLRPWSKARAKKAMAWLERQEAKGWGAFSDALSLLLAEEVDTIYFLSDGRPSRGRFDRGFRLIDELKRANRFRQVVIHTVLTGHARADLEFLEDLSASTGGRFSDAGAGSRR